MISFLIICIKLYFFPFYSPPECMQEYCKTLGIPTFDKNNVAENENFFFSFLQGKQGRNNISDGLTVMDDFPAVLPCFNKDFESFLCETICTK